MKRASASSFAGDPQKGRWGRLSERRGLRLSAKVKKKQKDGDWYHVTLRVEPTSIDRKLDDLVVFHLHDTFTPDRVLVAVKSGRAVLQLYAWGAFTVGAEADQGKTRLELDLAEQEDFPRTFRER